MEELRVEFTVKELVQHMNTKIDRLAEKFDNYADSVDRRMGKLEAEQLSAQTLDDFRGELSANSNKMRLGIYGLVITFLGVIFDGLVHFFHIR